MKKIPAANLTKAVRAATLLLIAGSCSAIAAVASPHASLSAPLDAGGRVSSRAAFAQGPGSIGDSGVNQSLPKKHGRDRQSHEVKGATIRIAGVSRPSSDATLAAVEAGRIEAIEFEEGDAVAVGDSVILLDHALQKLELERRRLIEQGKAQLEAARARVDMLQEVVASTRQLYEKTKSVSREELKSKELELRLAQAEVAGVELQEKRETVEREMAEQQLRRRRIVSPIDGIVVKIHKEVGETCSPADPLIRIANIANAHFDAYTEPQTASKLAVGMAVKLAFTPADSAALDGTVTFVSPVADPASGLQRITAAFTNTGRLVRPGQQGTLIVNTE